MHDYSKIRSRCSQNELDGWGTETETHTLRGMVLGGKQKCSTRTNKRTGQPWLHHRTWERGELVREPDARRRQHTNHAGVCIYMHAEAVLHESSNRTDRRTHERAR
uniref:Uncharacterized protein n=1 Tax=Anopheles minimus TaxID=112268 RepID=A0A182WP00_9DIPT